jgi:Tryptophan-associated transmembrane protein (Trp_oprn_chp)
MTTGLRPLWIVTGGLLLAALALWGSSRLTWATEVRGHAGTDASTVFARTGADIAPLVPLAVLALAGVAAAIAVGGWSRRAVGVVLAASGIGAAGLGLLAGPAADVFPWGRILAVLGGGLLVLAGLLLVVVGDRMPRLGAGYRAPATARRAEDTDSDLWRSLSHGKDPTTDEP